MKLQYQLLPAAMLALPMAAQAADCVNGPNPTGTCTSVPTPTGAAVTGRAVWSS